LKNRGFQTVTPASWHYGADAHRWWSKFLLDYVIQNNLV